MIVWLRACLGAACTGIWLRTVLQAAILAAAVCACPTARAADPALHVPILVYHRFGDSVTDAMTVTTPAVEAQIHLIQQQGHRIISARSLVTALRDPFPAIANRAVVITVDDGHRSVYSDLFPLVRRFRFPVTLFIYPTAISNAHYALTWEQLLEMKASGLVDVQSHTYWHPNFIVERRRLTADAYRRFVHHQLGRSMSILQERLGGKVDLLAWPFGIYDAQLMQLAEEAGYAAAFSIERRPVTQAEHPMALPRYLVTDADRGPRFEALLSGPVQTTMPTQAPPHR